MVGSSTDGAFGHVALGSVSDRLVHSSPVPVALATRGYRTNDAPVSRLVVAIDASRRASSLAQNVVPLAQQFKVPIEAVTFAVRRTTGYPSAIGPRADEAVFRVWREQVDEAHQVFGSALKTFKPSVKLAGRHVVEAARWPTAVESFEWGEGDLLVIGSSDHGPIRPGLPRLDRGAHRATRSGAGGGPASGEYNGDPVTLLEATESRPSSHA